MSKGKKDAAGAKGAEVPNKKAARGKPKAAQKAAKEKDEAIAAAEAEPPEEAARPETSEDEAPADLEAAAQSQEAAQPPAGEAERAEEPAAIGADEAVVAAPGEGAAAPEDDDVPLAPKGPDTPIAELPRADQRRLVESLVFVSDRPISAQQLGRMLKIKSALAKELADELVAEYAGRGIELVELSGGYQFRSAPSSAHVVREHIAQPPVRLTRAQLETLALVAYRQPITRPEIDDVRGVDSGSALRVLLERGLLKMLGRKDEPGRPLLYGTTPFFLDFFGMRSLKDLPTLREFTELSDENRALFKRKTGETIEEAEAALLAAEEIAQRDNLAMPAAEQREDEPITAEPTDGEPTAQPNDHDLEVEAETFAARSLQTSPDSADRDGESPKEEGELEAHELSRAPEA